MFILAYAINHKILKIRRYKRLTNAVKSCHKLIQVDNISSISIAKSSDDDMLDYEILEIKQREDF